MNRKTTQDLIPLQKDASKQNTYDIYPSFHIENDKIQIGYNTLAEKIVPEKTVILDGYIGIDWNEVITKLNSTLKNKSLNVGFMNINSCLKNEKEIRTI